MKFDDLMNEWHKDSQINRADILKEINGVGNLLYKYQDIYRQEAKLLTALKVEQKRLRRKLRQYYTGHCDQHELKDLNRVQFAKKIVKSEVDKEIDLDDDYLAIEARVENQTHKVETLKGIISHLQYTRPKQLNMTLDYLKWTGGME